MPSLLVLYGTHDGHTATIAHAAGAAAREAGWDIDIWPCRDLPAGFSLTPYDAVIVAAPVIAGRYAGATAKVVRQHHAALASRPNTFLSVSWSATNQPWAPPREQRERANARLFRQTNWRPQRIMTVAGAVRYTRHRRPMRWLIGLFIGRAAGPSDRSRDYDYTDWQALRRDTRAFLAAARPPVPVS